MIESCKSHKSTKGLNVNRIGIGITVSLIIKEVSELNLTLPKTDTQIILG